MKSNYILATVLVLSSFCSSAGQFPDWLLDNEPYEAHARVDQSTYSVGD